MKCLLSLLIGSENPKVAPTWKIGYITEFNERIIIIFVYIYFISFIIFLQLVLGYYIYTKKLKQILAY